MAYSNLSSIVLTDTFNTWVARSNSIISDINTLRNGNYVKDLGSLTSNTNITVTTNGVVTLQKTGGVGLIVQGSAQIQEGLTLGPSSTNVASAIANSANTVTVSANGASTRVANGLNFINTSTITVSVVGGVGSNANVAFSVVGGAAQGATGSQGTTGSTGSQGTAGGGGAGAQGAQGVQGAQGIQGRQGTQGVQGIQGLQGLQGPQGTQGVQGIYSPTVPRSTTTTTLTTGDVGKCVDAAAGITVPNATFSAGDIVSIYANNSAGITITQGASLSLRLAGTTTSGNRTLAGNGICTIWFVSGSIAVISGSGLS